MLSGCKWRGCGKIEWLELRSGDASALVRIEELLSGDAAKRIAWTRSDSQAAQPDGVKDLAEVKLTVSELRKIRIEVRVTLAEADGYRIGVYAWYDGKQTALSELAPSLTIGLNAGEQGDEAERAGYVATHRLSATDATGEITSLTGVLQKLPPDETAAYGRQSEYFYASLENGTNVVVLYDPEKLLDKLPPVDAVRRLGRRRDVPPGKFGGRIITEIGIQPEHRKEAPTVYFCTDGASL